MVKLYDRNSRKIIYEKESGKLFLDFLYNNFIGRIILKFLINPFISKIGGVYNNSFISKYKIKNFIKKNNININEYCSKNYKCFNDFFCRTIKLDYRPISDKGFISPADSKLSIYNITSDLVLNIKGSKYNLNELVGHKYDLSEYKNGMCLVFRLAVDDYHHYCYPDSGNLINKTFIKGKLHTVRSVSKEYKIYKLNQREFSVLDTLNFGEMIYIEVGALMVGKIVNHDKKKFKRGEEKGYFKLGGSTIVVLLKENMLKLDKDILDNYKDDVEILVKYREKIGDKYE